MRISTVIATPLIAVLAACGTPRPAPPAAPPPAVPAVPAPRTTLAGEQVRLAELFRGTPVTFTMQQDGRLRATVPRRAASASTPARARSSRHWLRCSTASQKGNCTRPRGCA